MKYWILVLITFFSLNVNADPIGECDGTPDEAVIVLPSPLSNWGQIVCTPYGHIISNKQGYIWSNIGTYEPVMIPSQMVRSNPDKTGNSSYFTSIDMVVLKGEEAKESIEFVEKGYDKSPTTPKVYSLKVTSISGKKLGFKFFDYGNSHWGIWCKDECDLNSQFILINTGK